MVLCGLLASCRSCGGEGPTSAPPQAHIQSAVGATTVRVAGKDPAGPATTDQGLYLEDVVTTGADGKASIEFVGGNLIDLGPNSSMVIRHIGATVTEVGAILLSGTMTARGGGKGIRMSIGTPYGVAEVGAKVSVLDVTLDKGMTIKVGDIEFVKDGVTKEATAGQIISVAGLVMNSGTVAAVDGLNMQVKQPTAAVTLKPLVFTLTAKPKAATILVAGTKVWKAASKRTTLHPGDTLRVKKGAAGTRLQMGDEGDLAVRGDSEVELTPVNQMSHGETAEYALRDGGMQVNLLHDDKRDTSHTLNVAGAKLRIKPTVREADVDITKTKSGAQVLVRFGQVIVGDDQVEAGSMFNVADGKIVGGVKSLATSKVDVRSRSNTVLYYDKKLPPVNFVWSEQPTAKPVIIEIATDRDFKQIVAAEAVKRGSLVVESLTPGKYFWRLDRDSASRGVLQTMQENDSDCANCKRSNFIDDTGEKTVVYFQQTLPAIVLRWKEVEGAGSYSLKVFADGEFDKPLVDEKSTQTKRSFDAGRFTEGKYYWLVSSLDDQSRELATGRMNSLQIAYDNAITALVIRSPRQGSQSGKARVTTSGEAELGARVYVNGKRIELDDKGRFNEALPLHPGLNQLVYRAVAADGIERLYLRDVLVKR